MHADRVFTWRDFDRRANAFARDLQRLGLKRNSNVAILAYNGPEWLEALYGAFKVSMVPVNTNYRYGPAEVADIYDNADAEVVLFHATFAPLLDAICGELPLVKQRFVISDGADDPDSATNYE